MFYLVFLSFFEKCEWKFSIEVCRVARKTFYENVDASEKRKRSNMYLYHL